MSEKVVWQMLQQYATNAGVPCIAPHDCRRSCAKLCWAGAASLRRSGCFLATPPNDAIKFRLGAKIPPRRGGGVRCRGKPKLPPTLFTRQAARV